MDMADITIAFQYGGASETVRAEIERNIKTIITTPMGTCPLYRDFGLDTSILDMPAPAAKNALAIAVIDAVDRWEPRAKVSSVETAENNEGRINVKVVVSIEQS